MVRMVLGSKSDTCSCGFSDDSEIPWAELGGSKISAIVEVAEAAQLLHLQSSALKSWVVLFWGFNI